MKLKIFLIVSCLGFLMGCGKTCSSDEDDEISTVPVTNNPHIAPNIMNKNAGPIPF